MWNQRRQSRKWKWGRKKRFHRLTEHEAVNTQPVLAASSLPLSLPPSLPLSVTSWYWAAFCWNHRNATQFVFPTRSRGSAPGQQLSESTGEELAATLANLALWLRRLATTEGRLAPTVFLEPKSVAVTTLLCHCGDFFFFRLSVSPSPAVVLGRRCRQRSGVWCAAVG